MTNQLYITVLSDESGSLEVDPRKNRLYLNVRSEQRQALDSSQVLEELHELKHHLSHGFTMLFDTRQGEFDSRKDHELFCDSMDLFLEGGLTKLAEVHSGPLKLELPQDCREDGIEDVQQAVFNSREEAEAWLDE